MITDPQELFDLLTHGPSHRRVYHGRDGRWFVTYGGGEVSADAVLTLRREGKIISVYSNCPTEAYHVGRTVDWKRSMERRKAKGKKVPVVYVGDP